MAFVEIDRDSADAFFVNDLVRIVDLLNNLHALLERTDERMQQMSTAQIETLYGVPGYGNVIKNNINNAFDVVDTNSNLDSIRTQLG